MKDSACVVLNGTRCIMGGGRNTCTDNLSVF